MREKERERNERYRSYIQLPLRRINFYVQIKNKRLWMEMRFFRIRMLTIISFLLYISLLIREKFNNKKKTYKNNIIRTWEIFKREQV